MQSRCLLKGFLQYVAKNMALLVQKFWGGKKLSKSVFGYFKTKKTFTPLHTYRYFSERKKTKLNVDCPCWALRIPGGWTTEQCRNSQPSSSSPLSKPKFDNRELKQNRKPGISFKWDSKALYVDRGI